MKKSILLFSVMCTLSLPAFAGTCIREMANETCADNPVVVDQETDNKVREMSLWERTVVAFKELFDGLEKE